MQRLRHPHEPNQAVVAVRTAALKLQLPVGLTADPFLLPKVCKACGVDKPASEFYRNRTNADGLFGAPPFAMLMLHT
jgi:hypothetical protein